MMRVSRSVMAVGGVVLAAGMIGLANPKAVHAVQQATTQLVQVVNTAVNPVVTQSVGQQAGQLVKLNCFESGTPSPCFSNGTPYVVPANESLVITAVDIDTSTAALFTQCNGVVRFDRLFLNDFNGTPLVSWLTNGAPAHLTYPSGIAAGPSSTLVARSSQVDGGCFSEFYVYGYLTAS